MVLVNGIVLIVGGGAVNNYSTTEQRIGTWIDGKPLYQITLTDTIPSGADSNNTNIITNSLIANIDFGIIVHAMVKDPTYNSYNMLNEPSTGANVKPSRVWISTGQSSIRGFVDTAYINFPMYITIQYTKTTD